MLTWEGTTWQGFCTFHFQSSGDLIAGMINKRFTFRRGPFEVSFQLAKSMEDSIEKDLVIFEEDRSDTDSDWNDSFPSDWENVQRGAILEEYGLQEMTNQQSFSQSVLNPYHDSFARSRNITTTSVTGGLVSSVTSFFRGWRK